MHRASTYHTQPLQCPPEQHSLMPMCQPPGSSQPPRAWCSGREALTLYQSAGFKFHLRDRWRQCPYPGAHGPRGLLAEPCTLRCQTGSWREEKQLFSPSAPWVSSRKAGSQGWVWRPRLRPGGATKGAGWWDFEKASQSAGERGSGLLSGPPLCSLYTQPHTIHFTPQSGLMAMCDS